MVLDSLRTDLCYAFNMAFPPSHHSLLYLDGVERFLEVDKALITSQILAQKHAERRETSLQYYEHQAQRIEKFFEDEGFEVAEVLFQYLKELKAGKWRKNGFVPDIGHEIDQILPLMTSLMHDDLESRLATIEKEHGTLEEWFHTTYGDRKDVLWDVEKEYGGSIEEWFCATQSGLKDRRPEIEAQYGSIEKWFCSIIGHDIGEDYNVFPQDLVQRLREGLIQKNGYVTEPNEALIQRAGRSMERLTHYRKFSFDEVENITGYDLSTLNLKPNEKIPLDELQDIFWEKMGVDNADQFGLVNRKRLQVFATWNEKRNRPEVIVTRYGRARETTPEEDVRYGPSWTSYIDTQAISELTGEDDLYDILAKMGDRVHGIATRIAVIPFSVTSYDKYLDETSLLFREFNAVNMALTELYPDTLLAPEFKSIDSMMGALHTVSKVYVANHPDKNLNGDKGISPEDIIADLKPFTPVNRLYLSPFGENMNNFYKHTDKMSHPVYLLMRDLRTAWHPDFVSSHRDLYNYFRDGFIEVGGDDIAQLIKSRPAEPQDPVLVETFEN